MEEGQQAPSPTIQYIQTPSTQQLDITKWQLEFEFEKFEHRLKGDKLVLNEDEEELWVKDDKNEPMLNDKGISWLVFIMSPVVSPSAMQANISREEAYQIGEETCLDILEGLYLQQRKFDMQTIHYNTIMTMAINIIHFAVTRPIGGEERKLMHSSRIVSENIENRPMEQKKQGLPIPFIGRFF